MGEPIRLQDVLSGRIVTVHALREARQMVYSGEYRYADVGELQIVTPEAREQTEEELRDLAKQAGVKHYWVKGIERIVEELEELGLLPPDEEE